MTKTYKSEVAGGWILLKVGEDKSENKEMEEKEILEEEVRTDAPADTPFEGEEITKEEVEEVLGKEEDDEPEDPTV